MTAGALGLPEWGMLHIIALPLAAGQMPQWTAAGMRAQFPHLIGWVLFGAALGLATQALTDTAQRWLGPEPVRPPTPTGPLTRVLILGGGFAGMTTAEALEKEMGLERV